MKNNLKILLVLTLPLFAFACSKNTPEEEAAERAAEAKAVMQAIEKANKASVPLPFGRKEELPKPEGEKQGATESATESAAPSEIGTLPADTKGKSKE